MSISKSTMGRRSERAMKYRDMMHYQWEELDSRTIGQMWRAIDDYVLGNIERETDLRASLRDLGLEVR